MSDDPALGAVAALVPALLQTLEMLGDVARHLHPSRLAALVGTAEDAPLRG